MLGLKQEIKSLSINGQQITDWKTDVELIRSSAGKELNFGIERDGVNVNIPITPTARVINGKVYGFIGIANKFAVVRSGPFSAISKSASTTKDFTVATVKSLVSLPGKIPALWAQTVEGEKRDPDGLVGVVGVARGLGTSGGKQRPLTIRASRNFHSHFCQPHIFVGILIFFPILPLDGGHMAVAIADEVRALFARIRGRSRPKAIDVTVLTPITMVVFVLLGRIDTSPSCCRYRQSN
ncbi:MAG: M50 family metallopeptidase [Actinomycetota bacterium]